MRVELLLPSIRVEGNYLVIRIPLDPDGIDFTKEHVLPKLADWVLPWLELLKKS